MRTSLWRLLGTMCSTAALLAASISVAGSAAGKQGPPPGHGPGGGETTLTNNLSVPTVMVAGGFTGVVCPTGVPEALHGPTGLPATGYPLDVAGFYYVQGLNAWQAQCYTATTASVTAAWGDNLSGDAALKTSAPIRVELGLFNADTSAPAMSGYTVVKLDPAALDRESAYGTRANGSPENGFSATTTTFTAAEQRVYDGGATLSIRNDSTGSYVVPVGTPAGAEINATGSVVYGYNLRVTAAGSYTITFTIPTVTVTGSDAGTFTEHSATLTIVVAGSTGRGSGGGSGR